MGEFEEKVRFASSIGTNELPAFICEAFFTAVCRQSATCWHDHSFTSTRQPFLADYPSDDQSLKSIVKDGIAVSHVNHSVDRNELHTPPHFMKTIAIDVDGVLLDYNTAYAQAWFRAFGERLALTSPASYWPMERWNARRLIGEELEQFRSVFDLKFWSTIPAIPGALEACERLADQGYTLVCVTALDERFADARTQNLRDLGFPISRVITTRSEIHSGSPKAQAIAEIQPVAFVDDYAPYLVGLDPKVHLALVVRDPVGSPNVGELLNIPDSKHSDLQAFTSWWLSQGAPVVELR